MTTFGNDQLTYLEMQKRTMLTGMPAAMVNPLTNSQPMLMHAMVKPTNNTFVHQSTVVTGEPTVDYAAVDEPFTSSRGSSVQHVDGCARIIAQSIIPAGVLDPLEDKLSYMIQEMRLFASAMSKKAALTIIEGSTATSIKQFNGLNVRYPSLGDNCLDCGGSTNLSSAWLIRWCDEFSLIHPKNIVGGMKHEDHGRAHRYVTTPSAGYQINYAETFEWYLGLQTADKRNACRVANVANAELQDFSGAQQLTDWATLLPMQMTEATTRLPVIDGNTYWYLPRSIYSGYLRMAQARALGNTFTIEALNGKPTLMHLGIPMYICDQLGYAESAVA